MLQINKIIVFLVIVLLLNSCNSDFFEKPINFDLDNHESKMAATAFLGADADTDQVLVSYSLGPFEENDNQLLNTATITLSDANTDIDFSLTGQDGFYKANSIINFVPNKAYTLTIEDPSYTTIISQQVYPERVPILEASLNTNRLEIKINDNPNQKNYYVLKLQKKYDDTYFDEYLDSFGSFSDYSGFCNTCIIFNDDTFNGTQNFEIVATNYNGYDENATYKVTLYNVTEDYFRYDQSLLQSSDAENNPFVEPVILHRNFKNGYGIFALVNKAEFIIN